MNKEQYDKIMTELNIPVEQSGTATEKGFNEYDYWKERLSWKEGKGVMEIQRIPVDDEQP